MNGIPLTEELKASLTQFYVYAYLRQRNSPIGNVGTPYYIGKGKDDRAWGTHRKTPGPKDISRIIIIGHNLTEEEAFTLEVKMIADYGRVDNKTGILRNRTDGGEGTSGVIRSDETRRKMSESQKGKIPSNETRRKLSESKQNISEETRRKISESKKNMSDETRRKMSESQKGKIRSDETRRKISESKKNMSDETRRKMSESAKSRRNTVASGSDIYAFLDGTS
jgi:hypothetical protein